MIRRALVLALLLTACQQDRMGPDNSASAPGAPAFAFTAIDEKRGPPEPYPFGRDFYRTGIFTGERVTPTGLDCSYSTAARRDCRGFLASDVDRARLDVTLQTPMTGGPYPLVALIHGYAGSKTSSGDIAAELLDSGYAVLRYSTRGFGDSWGQVNMTDVHAEMRDLRSMIAQVVDEPSFELNAAAVAVTGASYGGGHSWLAALVPTFTTPRGNTVHIRTVVPIAPWTDLLYSLIPNGRERRSVDSPGGLKLTYVNGLYASGIRRNPDRPYPNYPAYFIGWHAWINAVEPTSFDPVYRTIVDGLAGYRSIWWQQSFWSAAATAERVPIFQVQGFTDDLFPLPEAKRMLLALQTIDPMYPVATYLGDLGHPRARNKTAEVRYVMDRIQEWLKFYLKGGTAQQPEFVIRAAITRPGEGFSDADVITVPSYDQFSDRVLTKTFATPAVLVNPAADPMAGFVWDPFVMELSRELEPLPPAPESPTVASSLGIYEVPFAELASSNLLVAGQPLIYLHAQTTAYRVQLNVRLFDVGTGTKQLITRGTYTLDKGRFGVPLGDVDVMIPTYGNLWEVPLAHTLRLEISNLDSPYIAPSRVPSVTVISGVRLDVPARPVPGTPQP